MDECCLLAGLPSYTFQNYLSRDDATYHWLSTPTSITKKENVLHIYLRQIIFSIESPSSQTILVCVSVIQNLPTHFMNVYMTLYNFSFSRPWRNVRMQDWSSPLECPTLTAGSWRWFLISQGSSTSLCAIRWQLSSLFFCSSLLSFCHIVCNLSFVLHSHLKFIEFKYLTDTSCLRIHHKFSIVSPPDGKVILMPNEYKNLWIWMWPQSHKHSTWLEECYKGIQARQTRYLMIVVLMVDKIHSQKKKFTHRTLADPDPEHILVIISFVFSAIKSTF